MCLISAYSILGCQGQHVPAHLIITPVSLAGFEDVKVERPYFIHPVSTSELWGLLNPI